MIDIDESKLYGDDHHLQCLEYVRQFFETTRLPEVRSVYAMGSVVTGDYVAGASDLDVMVFATDADVSELIVGLRQLNEKLWIPTFHLHKPADYPPPDLYLRTRLHCEGKHLYGERLIGDNELDDPHFRRRLRDQLLASLSLRVVMTRSLCCSRVIEKYSAGYCVHQSLKLLLFGIRGFLMLRGDDETSKKHVVAWATGSQELSDGYDQLLVELIARQREENYPEDLNEQIDLFLRAVGFLELVQGKIASMV